MPDSAEPYLLLGGLLAVVLVLVSGAGAADPPPNVILFVPDGLRAAMVSMETAQVGFPIHVTGHGKCWIGELKTDELDVIGECGAKQATHIFKNEGARLEFAYGPHRLGKHIAVVLIPPSLSAHGKRLARRPTRY